MKKDELVPFAVLNIPYRPENQLPSLDDISNPVHFLPPALRDGLSTGPWDVLQ